MKYGDIPCRKKCCLILLLSDFMINSLYEQKAISVEKLCSAVYTNAYLLMLMYPKIHQSFDLGSLLFEERFPRKSK